MPLSGKVNASFWYNFYSYDTYPYDEFIGIVGNGSIGGKDVVRGRTSNSFPYDPTQWNKLKSTGWKYSKTEIGEVEVGSDVFFFFEVVNRYDALYKNRAFIDDLALSCVGCPICKGTCIVPSQKVIIHLSNTQRPHYMPVYEVKNTDLCRVERKGDFSSEDLLGVHKIISKDPIKFEGSLQPPY